MKKRFFAMVLSCMAVCGGVLATSDPGALYDIDPTLGDLARVAMPVVPPASYKPENYEGFYPGYLVEEFSHVLARDQYTQLQKLTQQMNRIIVARRLFKDGQGFFQKKLPAFPFDDPTLTPSDLGKLKADLNVLSDTIIAAYGFTSSKPGHLISLTIPDLSFEIRPEIIGFKEALNKFCKERGYPRGASIYIPDSGSPNFKSVLAAYNAFVSPETASDIGQKIYALHLSEPEDAARAVINGLIGDFCDEFGQ